MNLKIIMQIQKKKKANRDTQKVDSWLPRDGDRGM